MGNHRMIGTGINVTDLQRSLAFYEGALGFKETQRYEFPGLSEVLLACGEDAAGSVLVLVHHDERAEPYLVGDAFSRILVGVPDAMTACALIRELGGAVVQEPADVSVSPAVIAMATDPDGFPIEVIQLPDET